MLNYDGLKEYLEKINCAYSENEEMSQHTTFKIGGPADIFVKPVNNEMCAGIINYCRENDLPLHFLGGGSNLLVSDFGIRGVVLHTGGLSDICLDGCDIVCSAGVKLSRLCAFALENSLSGLEFAWGIPGTLGGAVFMNAGAYGGEMKDVLVSSTHITPQGEIEFIDAADMKLGYRTSVYHKNNCLVTEARMRLTMKNPDEIRSVMDDLIQRRKSKQPIEFPSAGSTFKRPEGNFAGTLIEQEGLKGERVGGAVVSEKHAGFIINDGDATCSDVLRLIEKVQERVFNNTGIQLECEVKVVK